MEILFIKLLGIYFPLYFGDYYKQLNQPKAERDAFLEGLQVQFDYLMSNPQIKLFLFDDFNDRCHDWYDDH